MDHLDPFVSLKDVAEGHSVTLTVIVLTYNHERFVEEALESVLAQRCDFEWEVIVADDASTDLTRAIVHRFARGHAVIKVLPPEPNLGMQNNFRRALVAARGTFVALLEGDDYWSDPDKLKLQVAALQRDSRIPAVGHLTSVQVVDESGLRIESTASFNHDFRGLTWLMLGDVLKGNFPHASSLVFRREWLSTTPAWFDDLVAADSMICALLARNGPLQVIPIRMSVYRKNSGSTWTPRPHLERKPESIRCIQALARHSDTPSRVLAPALGKANITVAALAAELGNRKMAASHLASAVYVAPGWTTRWLIDYIRRRRSYGEEE